MKKIKNKSKLFNKLGSTPLFMMILIIVGAIALVIIISCSYSGNGRYMNYFYQPETKNVQYAPADKIAKFQSEQEFKEYLEESTTSNSYYGWGGMGMGRDMMLKNEIVVPTADIAFDEGSTSAGSAQRYSETNVQVLGIDEADIVKTNGQEIYFSDPNYLYYGIGRAVPMMAEDLDAKIMPDIMPPIYQSKTSLINAWPIDALALDSQLDLNGNLLLYKDTLIVLGNDNNIYGYNVSDPKNPTKSWEMEIANNSSLVSSRLVNGQIYLITNTYIDSVSPCPYKPLIFGDNSLEIRCTDIYHPITPTYTDSSYTVISMDAQSGEIKDSVSFLGSNYNSLVYMSQDNLYITYASDMPNFDISYEFFSGAGRELIPAEVLVKLNKLKTYDISYRAKEVELETILSDWQNSLNADQKLKLQNDLENKITDYYKENKRRFISTGIVKIDLNNMDIADNGKVPGRPLNQFSLDEYNGNLRLATNIGGSGFGMMFFNSDQSANDVYVLNKNLDIIGSVKDLGLSEQIYSVRFIEDRGYVVTYKQIDPFYVLDLSDPKNPLMTGELKIPGYSSYLHQLKDNKILGIGLEDSKLKLSYFDVSDPKNPQEVSKYNLDEYGSDTLYDHHAFLADEEKEIFFLPGYNGGYIFSYAGDKLELVKAVSLANVKRALYIEDYLYVIATDSLIVLDEKNWEEVNDLEFKK